ncbi:hypothetical protein EI77_00412 [Prosthecobacter fusiformis]|uniref:GH25 family protein n=1 Tax=Prosthecobacter fusiformis TaxID=48464 RepID=A0A4R7SPI3_9BACT|nr:hypothetical protein [Prosthecobacter fusiformis]TDU81110.1 hypothetical protein EI77_00412 [Prosthecobacter fusiformis]
MFRPILFYLVVSLTAWLPSAAFAHSVWIENLPGDQLCVRFAEWGEDFEVSPGHLDSFALVSGFTLNAEGKPEIFDVVKKQDQFFLGKASAAKPAFAQAHFEVRKLHEDKPARAPIFYSRWQPEGAGEGKPTMTLDIVPTGQPGEARVFFRGKPLGGIEVGLHAPKGDEQKLVTDAEGLVRVADLSKPGPYLLTVARYSEELPGFFNGVPFAISSHSASLYWTVKKTE